MNIQLIHDNQVFSIAHMDGDRNMYTYWFELAEGKLKVHSIDRFTKNGTAGKTYKHEEIYHHEYKNWILLENGDYGKPDIPEEVMRHAEYYRKGYLQSCL